MFVRRGESLGSVVADVDPSEVEKQQKRSAAAKKAAETRAANAESGVVPREEQVDAAPEPEAEPEPDEESGPPKHAELKPAWVDYAVSQGADREEAEALTKPELIEMYGADQ